MWKTFMVVFPMMMPWTLLPIIYPREKQHKVLLKHFYWNCYTLSWITTTVCNMNPTGTSNRLLLCNGDSNSTLCGLDLLWENGKKLLYMTPITIHITQRWNFTNGTLMIFCSSGRGRRLNWWTLCRILIKAKVFWNSPVNKVLTKSIIWISLYIKMKLEPFTLLSTEKTWNAIQYCICS